MPGVPCIGEQDGSSSDEDLWTAVTDREETDWIDLPVTTAKQDLADEAVHQGLLVALPIVDETAAQLALPGGEDVDDLHLTLCYCPGAEQLGDDGVDEVVTAVRMVAQGTDPLTGTIGGVGVLRASETSDGQDVIVALPDVPGLNEFRAQIASALTDIGLPPSDAHGFVPHVTLAYVEPGVGAAPMVPPVPLKFDRVIVSIGDREIVVPLGPVMEVSLANPYHDEHGQFTSAEGDSGGGGGAGQSVKESAAHKQLAASFRAYVRSDPNFKKYNNEMLSRMDAGSKALSAKIQSIVPGTNKAIVNEDDNALIAEFGKMRVVAPGEAVHVMGIAGQCHSNAATLYRNFPDKFDLVTGLYSSDGFWRGHSWVVEKATGKLFETTGNDASHYFGVTLPPKAAEAFTRAQEELEGHPVDGGRGFMEKGRAKANLLRRIR